MKLQHIFQLFILPVLLFSPIGNSGRVQAAVDVNTESSVTTSIDSTSVNVGDSALVSVSLNNVPGGGYSSAEFTCTYNPNLLEAGSIVVSNLFGADALTVISAPQNGKFILAIAGSKGNKATTSGTVFTFNVKGLQAGQVEIECTARISKGDKILSNIPSVGTSLNVLGDGTPSLTPTPTVSPTVCDKAQFIANITVPDGTVMSPGVTFLKSWRLKNIGSCTWSNYSLIFDSGEKMGGPASAILPASVAPGQTVDLTITLTSPITAGTYRGYWKLKNNNGIPFGIGSQASKSWWVEITVAGTTVTSVPSTNSPTPTVTPSVPTNSATPSITPSGPTATPMSGVVFDFVANACSASWFSYAGQLPCPGIDGEAKGFMLMRDHPILETGVADTRRGLLMVPQNINNGYIQGIYQPFKVQSGDRFHSIVGCEDGATNCYVVFRLDYAVGSDPTIKTFWAFVERYEGIYYSADIDLSPLAGQDVRFILTVSSTGSALDDRALWIAPAIYRADAGPTPVPSSTPTVIHTSTPSTIGTSTPTAINTPTTTATDMPALTVTGQVLASKPVTVGLYDVNNLLAASVISNSDGTFSLTAPAGTYTIIATANGYLSTQGYVTLTLTGASTMPTVSLPAGDIDDNNVIDQFDALTIGMNYNAAIPIVADLNNDGIINVLDLELLAHSYRMSGSLAWH